MVKFSAKSEYIFSLSEMVIHSLLRESTDKLNKMLIQIIFCSMHE
jgi:hypothetical protein